MPGSLKDFSLSIVTASNKIIKLQVALIHPVSYALKGRHILSYQRRPHRYLTQRPPQIEGSWATRVPTTLPQAPQGLTTAYTHHCGEAIYLDHIVTDI